MERALGFCQPLYSLRKNWYDRDKEYGVLSLEDIRVIVKIMEIVTIPKARVHVFSSAVQFPPWYKDVAAEKRKKCTTTREETR